jgi:AraC family transcriptional regulator, transcriptional activator of pobA
MNSIKDILVMECPASCEKVINRECGSNDLHSMMMPGILQDKHKNLNSENGIPSSRRKFNLIYMILKGVQDVQLGTEYRWIKPNDLVVVPENMVYASKNAGKCFGYCLHFKTEFIQQLFRGTLTDQFPFLDLEAKHIISTSRQESMIIQKAFRDIIEEYGKFSQEKEQVLRNLVYILLLRIREVYRSQSKTADHITTRSLKLCYQFRHLVEKNFLQIRSVKLYAEMLNITPQYLSDVVKSELGKSPRKLINEMLTHETKILLGSTDKTLTEIAYLLRFDDQAHFSHFIKTQTGHSPSALRKML